MTVSVLLGQILYFALPVCRPMCRQDITKSLIYRIIFLLRSLFPAMMVSPQCSSYRRTILQSSTQLFHFLGYKFLFYRIMEKFSISSSTCITFGLQGIILYIVSILSPLTLILILQDTSDILIFGYQYLLHPNHTKFSRSSLMCHTIYP